MSRIESVSVAIARVPLDNAVPFSTRAVTAREYCLVNVRSRDGVEDIGYCYAAAVKRYGLELSGKVWQVVE